MSTTTAAPRKYKVGDKVTPDVDAYGVPRETLGRVFTVAKVNPKNLRCTADDGGRGLNFPASILVPATDENIAKGQRPAAGLGRPFVPREHFVTGEIVTVNSTKYGLTPETPLIVTKDDGRDKVNLVVLGGDGDRYLRWPASQVVKRSREWLAEALMDEATR